VRYWLFKSEPESFSIDDLERVGTEPWDGIRNYQARNFLRDDVAVGDRILFYHSNAKPPGVVGLAEVASEAYPDPTAFDPAAKYFDPKSDPDAPTWMLVDVRHVETFPRMVSLDEIRSRPELADMVLVQRSRLSIQPVEPGHFERICELAHHDAD
jgi:predicted RNA-binding protein with PUA-like domain